MGGEIEAAAEPVDLEIEMRPGEDKHAGKLVLMAKRSGIIEAMTSAATAEQAIELATDHARQLSRKLGQPVRIFWRWTHCWPPTTTVSPQVDAADQVLEQAGDHAPSMAERVEQLVERVAAQQAMPDDSYRPELAQILRELVGISG